LSLPLSRPTTYHLALIIKTVITPYTTIVRQDALKVRKLRYNRQSR